MLVILIWIHILANIGVFGGLLALQAGVPAQVRNSPDVASGAARLFNIMIGIGLLAGFALYVLKHGGSMGPHYNGIIGMKFAILVAVGGLLAMSKKPGKGDLFRSIAMVLLAIAALAGLTIS